MGVSPCHTLKVWCGVIFTWSLQGFHRYSTDQHWHVPHFEKMLYDQGQLAAMYSRAFQVQLWHPSVHLPLLQVQGLAWFGEPEPVPQDPPHPMGLEHSASFPVVYPEVLHKPLTVQPQGFERNGGGNSLWAGLCKSADNAAASDLGVTPALLSICPSWVCSIH